MDFEKIGSFFIRIWLLIVTIPQIFMWFKKPPKSDNDDRRYF